jgi:hypothetical protein
VRFAQTSSLELGSTFLIDKTGCSYFLSRVSFVQLFTISPMATLGFNIMHFSNRFRHNAYWEVETPIKCTHPFIMCEIIYLTLLRHNKKTELPLLSQNTFPTSCSLIFINFQQHFAALFHNTRVIYLLGMQSEGCKEITCKASPRALDLR